jgi:hypothetical protein
LFEDVVVDDDVGHLLPKAEGRIQTWRASGETSSHFLWPGESLQRHAQISAHCVTVFKYAPMWAVNFVSHPLPVISCLEGHVVALLADGDVANVEWDMLKQRSIRVKQWTGCCWRERADWSADRSMF